MLKFKSSADDIGFSSRLALKRSEEQNTSFVTAVVRIQPPHYPCLILVHVASLFGYHYSVFPSAVRTLPYFAAF
jgi:hypothetical protein